MSEDRPLRAIALRCDRGRHVLECGHRMPLRFTAYGMSATQQRARCDTCPTGAPSEYTSEELDAFRAGKPVHFDLEGGRWHVLEAGVCDHGVPYSFRWDGEEPQFVDGPDCDTCYPETLP